MKDTTAQFEHDLYLRYPQLSACQPEIHKAYLILETCFRSGHKLLTCGNGGSAADSDHIVGELMKGFLKRRPITGALRDNLALMYGSGGSEIADGLQGALPAISLVQHAALITAFANDVAPDMIFAQQTAGYGRAGDVLIAISTSGNSRNVVRAVQVASAIGMSTIGLTGAKGSKLSVLCDAAVCVPEQETFKVQELHLPVYHALCCMLEEEFFTD